MAVSNATICANCVGLGAWVAWACPSVASVAWLVRLCGRLMDFPGMLPETVSRPSHITALRNVKFVAGSGRRYMAGCVAVVSGQLYGSWMLMIWNSAFGGTGIEMRSRALLSSWLYAARRA